MYDKEVIDRDKAELVALDAVVEKNELERSKINDSLQTDRARCAELRISILKETGVLKAVKWKMSFRHNMGISLVGEEVSYYPYLSDLLKEGYFGSLNLNEGTSLSVNREGKLAINDFEYNDYQVKSLFDSVMKFIREWEIPFTVNYSAMDATSAVLTEQIEEIESMRGDLDYLASSLCENEQPEEKEKEDEQ